MSDDFGISDGSEFPEGTESENGELRVVDRQWTETELGRHQRWMRTAPDLYELYEAALMELAKHRS